MSVSSVSGKSFFYEKISARWNQTGVQMEEKFDKAVSELCVQKNGWVNLNAVFECKVRQISYSESDHVKAFVAEGYTLKAQVQMDAHRVYIEQKNEDGSSYAYEVNPFKIPKDTKNPIEQMALEAWEKARALFNDGTFTEYPKEAQEEAGEEDTFAKRLREFHEFVEKRIKEGPPKIAIGASEFSEKEWEQLLRKIDADIDAYKEELRERIRKQKEEDAKGQPMGSATEKKSLAETAGVEAGEKKTDGSVLLEKEAIENTSSSGQAGTSFLARLSGKKKAPYSYLADESGMIVYNGVTFVCDDKKQSICLGDMSNPNRVLTIPLSKGGRLRVNKDNLGDLVKAIGMFSPEDQARILRAIAQEKKIDEMELEIEELKSEVGLKE